MYPSHNDGPNAEAECTDLTSDVNPVFGRGRIVVLSLVNPREKFWGALLTISSSGVSLRGLDLGSFEGAVAMIRDGDQSSPVDVFFPMHRVERMEADSDTNGIPSLQERFEKATGQEAAKFFKSGSPRTRQ